MSGDILYMAELDLVKYPDELLHKKSTNVDVFDDKLKKIVTDMFDTMRNNNGIGLAGVQVGILKRIIVIEIIHEDIDFSSEIINPKIVSFSQNKSIMNEGCLSVSNKTYDVERPEEVEVEYQTCDGQWHKIYAKGLLAKCFQHEIDHLNGITIVDRNQELNRK